MTIGKFLILLDMPNLLRIETVLSETLNGPPYQGLTNHIRHAEGIRVRDLAA